MIILDRNRPSLFHQDYWHLRALREAVDQFVARHEARLHGAKIIDFGSSNGPYVQLLESKGATVTLADIQPDRPEILPIDLQTGRVPVEDSSVDIVLSTQVLEHVPEVHQYLTEAHRMLKPDGVMFLTTHGTWYLHRLPTDMRRWTMDGLKYDIEKAGFVVDSVEPKIGILATATHARAVAMRDFLLRHRVLAPLRVITNFLFNLRMGIEEMLTSDAGRDRLQQSLIVSARAVKRS